MYSTLHSQPCFSIIYSHQEMQHLQCYLPIHNFILVHYVSNPSTELINMPIWIIDFSSLCFVQKHFPTHNYQSKVNLGPKFIFKTHSQHMILVNLFYDESGYTMYEWFINKNKCESHRYRLICEPSCNERIYFYYWHLQNFSFSFHFNGVYCSESRRPKITSIL